MWEYTNRTEPVRFIYSDVVGVLYDTYYSHYTSDY